MHKKFNKFLCVTKNKEVEGFQESKSAAKEGGEVAGNARKDAEKRIGESITHKKNFLESKKKKMLE